MQLDVEPVLLGASELRDPVALLEDEHELPADVVHPVELIEPEEERARVLAALNSSRPSTLFARPNAWPSWSVNSQFCRGAVHSSIVAANTVSASSTCTSRSSSARSAGVGLG